MIALIFLLAVLEPWVHGRSCCTYQHRSRNTSNVGGRARAHACNSRKKVGLRCCERNSCTSYCDNWNDKALPHEKKTGICKQTSNTCRRPSYTFYEARQFCQRKGKSLCTKEQLSTICRRTGCHHSFYQVWYPSNTARSSTVDGQLNRAGEAESSSSGYSLVIVGISLGLVGMICSVGAYVLHRKRKTGNKDAMPLNQSSDGLQSSRLPHKSSRMRSQKQHSRVRGGVE
eukprot:GEMP01050764.1.p1 GENE.GEMP01050764.1~~GEMP01050764.1.p1  ORF type:complete len:229 (+),score=12.73 GEMP01050764.1:158-844(+)